MLEAQRTRKLLESAQTSVMGSDIRREIEKQLIRENEAFARYQATRSQVFDAVAERFES
jgi:hypothetical protein